MSHIDDPTKTSPEKGAETATAATLPEITQQEFINTLRQKTGKTVDEIMSMDDKTLQETVKDSFENTDGGKPAGTVPPPQNKEEGKTEGDKPKEKPVDEEAEVTVSIKPSLLKSFKVEGRDLKDVLPDVVRRAKEGEDTIEVLQKRTIPNLTEEIGKRDKLLSTATEENATLKSELAALRAKKTEEQTHAPASAEASAGVDELPAYPDISDDEEFDPFDPEARKKFSTALQTMRKRDEILVKKIAAASAPKQEKTPETPEPVKKPQQPDSRLIYDEFQAARGIQSHASYSDLMRTTRDITAINQDYVTFGQKLAGLYGIPKAIDDRGMFTPATSKVLVDYFDPLSPDGEKIRSAAAKSGITPPSEDELMALRRISTVRAIQKSHLKRDTQGNIVPIPLDEAFAIAQGQNPNLFKRADPIAARRDELEKEQKALENRARHATDVPPALGADMNEVSKIPMERFMTIITKPADKWTVEEAEAVKAVMKANGLKDDEIKFFVEKQT